MALLLIEGFESFGQTNGNAPVGLQNKYDNANADSNFTIQAGRVSGKSMRLPNGTALFGSTLGTPGTVVAGFGFYQDAKVAGTVRLRFYDNTSVQGSLQIQTDGTWKYYRGDGDVSGTSLGQSSGHTISNATWYYIELKIKFHSSTGTVDIWVDGNNVLSLTSQNTSQTGNAQATRFTFAGSGNGTDHTQYDDLYILDDTGSVNNARLGARIVKIIYPASDAGTNQYTPNSGSNHYDRVNENTQDTTTYLEDDTATHRELFVMDTLHFATIAGIQMNTAAKVTDNNLYTIKNSLHTSGGTDSDDTGKLIADAASYATYSRVVETNPQTSALWTETAVNAATFGFKTG